MAEKGFWPLLLLLHLIAVSLAQQQVDISWDMRMYGVEEGAGAVELCATIDPPVNITVTIFTIQLSADPGTDYRALNETFARMQWTEATPTSCIQISIVNDDVVETEEVFIVAMGTVVSRDSSITLPSTLPRVMVMIMDDDPINVIFTTPPEQLVGDDVGETEVCVGVGEMKVASSFNFRIPVTVGTADGTATAGTDFTPLNNMTSRNTGVLTPSNPEACFKVTINERTDTTQNDRNFLVTLRLTAGAMTTPATAGRIQLAKMNTTIVVMPTTQVPIAAGDKMDTIDGDPLYTVTLNANGNTDRSLCYEIHGARNTFLNLVSHRCFSINAHYSEVVGSQRRNVIDQVAIRTGDLTDRCVDVYISAHDECGTVFVRHGTRFLRVNQSFYIRGVRVQFEGERSVEVSLPCSEFDGSGIRVVFKCPSELYYDTATKQSHDVNRMQIEFLRNGNTRFPKQGIHGLVGQFWRHGFTLDQYTGQFSDGSLPDNAYTITTPLVNNAQRTIVGLEYPLTWDHRKQPCLYVGDRQGAASIDAASDSVIDGSYSDYRVSFHFAVDGNFNVFDNSNYSCPLFPLLPIRPTG